MNTQTQEATRVTHQLAAARMILAATGKSPRQIGEESRLKVIQFIYQFGYTSAGMVQLLLNRTAAGYAQKLARQGWLVATKTISGNPVSIFTLSERGLQEAERHSPALYRYPETDPYRVNQQQIRHYLLAQQSTINAINAGVIKGFETERMIDQAGDKPGVKKPDAVWIGKTGLRIAVEIELSAKWARDLDDFVASIARALQSSNDPSAAYHRFAIISDSKAIIERYRAAVAPNQPLAIWEKNQRGHWVVDHTSNVPAWLISKIDFQLVGK